ncbi:MAG: hypothetical protein ACYDBV_14670, partial [Nitrospiria bacterium]
MDEEVSTELSPVESEIKRFLDNMPEVKAEVEEASPKEDKQEVKAESIEEFSDIEKEAMEKGWNPKGIPGKRHKSAEEFLDAGVLIEKLESIAEENRKYRDAVEHLLAQSTQKEQKAYARALRDLEARRDAAIEEGNLKQVKVIEAQSEQLKAEIPQPV